MIVWNKVKEIWEDEETNLCHRSKTGLKAKVKRFNLDIPYHPFLSNRFVLNKIEIPIYEEDEK